MLQVKEQRRRLARRSRHHLSWITIENDIRSYECQVLDVSTDGAKLVADIEAPIGSTFQLPIVPQSIVQRRCEVVLRKGRMIGVKFSPEAPTSPSELRSVNRIS
jgi:PilZ domain